MQETNFVLFYKANDCYKYLWPVLEMFPKWLLLNFVHWAPAASGDLQMA